MSSIGQRLAEEEADLERLDAERKRRGDLGFGRAAEDRIVWGELLELELQDIDEQVNRICGAVGGAMGRSRERPLIRTHTCAKEVLMNATTHEPLNLNSEELAVLAELLESERAKLLVEIRHTDHRAFRDELRHRLTVVESLVERCRPI